MPKLFVDGIPEEVLNNAEFDMIDEKGRHIREVNTNEYISIPASVIFNSPRATGYFPVPKSYFRNGVPTDAAVKKIIKEVINADSGDHYLAKYLPVLPELERQDVHYQGEDGQFGYYPEIFYTVFNRDDGETTVRDYSVLEIPLRYGAPPGAGYGNHNACILLSLLMFIYARKSNGVVAYFHGLPKVNDAPLMHEIEYARDTGDDEAFAEDLIEGGKSGLKFVAIMNDFVEKLCLVD